MNKDLIYGGIKLMRKHDGIELHRLKDKMNGKLELYK